ncbi:somatostatin receptor type 5-like [Stigmatopora nigra]
MEAAWENDSSAWVPPNGSQTAEVGHGGDNDAGSVLLPLVYLAVCAAGLGGNTLVIHVALRHSKAESATNTYILNLALADELFMLGLPFLAAQNSLQAWPFGSFMCRLVMTVDSINQFTSIFCLTVMSVDRYLAVARPLRSARWRRPRVAKAVNAAVWALSFLVVLPVVVFADIHQTGGTCNILWPAPVPVWRAAFIVYTSTVGFLFPLLVICLCYLLIVFKVRSSAKKVHAAAAASGKRRRSERKVTRMVVIVVAVFVLCWLPFYALNVLNLLVALPTDYQGLYYFVVVLGYANSCANPVVYGFMSDNFKRGFRKALCRHARKAEHRRVGPPPPSAPARDSPAGGPSFREVSESRPVLAPARPNAFVGRRESLSTAPERGGGGESRSLATPLLGDNAVAPMPPE